LPRAWMKSSADASAWGTDSIKTPV
jgi:hypothetical protein